MKHEDPQVVWHEQSVSRAERERLMGHHGCLIWFTGLSGSGKSTVANAVDNLLHQAGAHTFLLDGDNIRHGLCAGANLLEPSHGIDFSKRFGLGFDSLSREENIRRIGTVAQLFVSAGLITLTAFVSPYRRDRQRVRDWLKQHGSDKDFIEVFVDTPLEICEARDPKGLYRQARAGQIPNFTGISDPYEPPEAPEIHLAGGETSPEESARQVIAFLEKQGVLTGNT